MSKRILVTSTDVMMLQFLVPHVFNLQEHGYEVEVACSDVEGHIKELEDIFRHRVKMFVVKLQRNPVSLKNFIGFKQMAKIINNGNYDLIWTNEPVMGVITRLAAQECRKQKKIKILYVAHGFHFFKGAPMKNWMVFYPIEQLLSKFTDEIVTINQEDYILAKKRFSCRKIKYFPGIGINTSRFYNEISEEVISHKRKTLGILEDEKLIVSVGELEKRKNHETSIRAFAQANIPKAKMIICGVGTQQRELEKLILDLQLDNKVFLLGYRYDISELCHASDVFLFTTFQEGLSVALMEAMAVGMPCIVSKIRGNIDLIEEGKGIYVNPHNVESCKDALISFFKCNTNWEDIITFNRRKVKNFDFNIVQEMLLKEIKDLLNEKEGR